MRAYSSEEMGMSRKVTVNALDCAAYVTGCFLKNGRLTPAYEAVNTDGRAPENTAVLTYSLATQRYFACTDSETYVSGDGENFVKVCSFASPFAFLLEDYAGDMPRSIFVTGDRATVYTGNTQTVKTLKFPLLFGAMHCGRVFGIDGNNPLLLRWSGAGGIEDWEESLNGSGQMHLAAKKGKAVGVFPFGKRLAVVQKFGITLLDMQSEPEKFSVSFTEADCASILSDTACAIGEKLYFFTNDGLKVFDGKSISPVAFLHDDEIENPCRAVAYDGKYFAACTVGASGNKAVACVDIQSGGSCIIDYHADNMFVNNGLILSGPQGFARLCESGGFTFLSNEINFGTGREKTVVEMFIEGVCDVLVSSGNKSRFFTSASGLIRPKLRGKSFTVTLDGNGEISKVLLTAEVLDAI